MKRITPILLALFVMGSVMVGAAIAQSSGAHFQKSSVKAQLQNDGDLKVSFVEAGLGNYNIDYTLSGHVDATYFCRTNSGSIPNAANKYTADSDASSSGSFEPKNGKVIGYLTLNVPAAPSSDPPTCGNGQSLDLQSVTWSNVVLTDTTNSVVFSFGSQTFTVTFYAAP